MKNGQENLSGIEQHTQEFLNIINLTEINFMFFSRAFVF